MNAKSKRKILIVDAFKGTGGEEEIAFYLYKNLSREKYQVYIAGLNNSPYFKKNKPKTDEWLQCKTYGKINVNDILNFRTLVKKNKIDLIHVHGYSAGYFVRVACLGLRDIKIVWTMHLNIADVVTMNSFKRILSTFIENILCKFPIFTNHIICVCNDSKEQLLKRGITNTPISVIYNGIDNKKFEGIIHNSNSMKLRLGFISRLSVQKNIPVLLQAIKKLSDNGYDISLVIAGEGEMEQFLLKYIEENSLKSTVSFVGFQKNITPLLKNIDLLLLPSLYECFPVIILEALCSGTPVIASNINGVPEVIVNGENGRLIQPNVDDLYNAIKYYSNNRKEIETQGINGRNLVLRKFTKDIMLSNHEKLYDNILENEK